MKEENSPLSRMYVDLFSFCSLRFINSHTLSIGEFWYSGVRLWTYLMGTSAAVCKWQIHETFRGVFQPQVRLSDRHSIRQEATAAYNS